MSARGTLRIVRKGGSVRLALAPGGANGKRRRQPMPITMRESLDVSLYELALGDVQVLDGLDVEYEPAPPPVHAIRAPGSPIGRPAPAGRLDLNDLDGSDQSAAEHTREEPMRIEPRLAAPPDARSGRRGRGDGRYRAPRPAGAKLFHPVYNFIPWSTREKLSGTPLGDAPAPSFDSYHEDCLTGRITIRITARTPLLIPDAASRFPPDGAEKNHYCYRTLTDADDLPVLPASSLKGALRTAYEAITDSRLGSFDSNLHSAPVRFRAGGAKRNARFAPADLVPRLVGRPQTPEQLSPADRIFGTRTAGDRAIGVRGRLAFSDAVCTRRDGRALRPFSAPLPLAVLGEPKVQQGRFYAAATPEGAPYDDGLRREEHYAADDHGLRGRKVYLFDRRVCDNERYWDPESAEWVRTPAGEVARADGLWLEYRRPRDASGREQLDKMNRSLCDWVREGTTFTATIDVHDAPEVDIGALLWLLELPDDRMLRLGGGRPLGFGVARVEVDGERTQLSTGTEIARSLRLMERPRANVHPGALRTRFLDATARVYGVAESAPHMRAFLAASAGHSDGIAVHHPRFAPQPDPEGNQYRWSQQNEKVVRGSHPHAYSLPALDEDEDALPFLM